MSSNLTANCFATELPATTLPVKTFFITPLRSLKLLQRYCHGASRRRRSQNLKFCRVASYWATLCAIPAKQKCCCAIVAQRPSHLRAGSSWPIAATTGSRSSTPTGVFGTRSAHRAPNWVNLIGLLALPSIKPGTLSSLTKIITEYKWIYFTLRIFLFLANINTLEDQTVFLFFLRFVSYSVGVSIVIRFCRPWSHVHGCQVEMHVFRARPLTERPRSVCSGVNVTAL